MSTYPISEWTDEDADNAMKYATCFVCRGPREMRTVGQMGDEMAGCFLICPRCPDLYDGPDYAKAQRGERWWPETADTPSK